MAVRQPLSRLEPASAAGRALVYAVGNWEAVPTAVGARRHRLVA